MKTSISKIFAAFGLVTVMYACDGFLEEVNPNDPNEAGFFVSDVQAIQTLNSTYATLQTRGFYKRQYFPVEMLAGDWKTTDGSNQQWKDLANLKIDPSNPEIISSLWVEAFKGISRANFTMEKVGEMAEDQIDPALQSRIIGEAQFIRGLIYFHLVTVYGKVPIIDHVINTTEDESFKPVRNEIADVWAFIEADFTAAAAVLPKFEEYSGDDVGRASKGAAMAMLGKAHLYQAEWSDAVTAFGNVVNNPATYGAYQLLSNFNDNFGEATENNAESLFEVHFLGGLGNVWAGDDTGGETESSYYGTEFSPYHFANVYPSQEINDFFDANQTGTDVRRFYTIARPGDDWDGETVRLANDTTSLDPLVVLPGFNARIINAGGSTGVRKHISGYGVEPFLQSGNNIRILRFADVKLMYAEALNETNQTSLAIAQMDDVRLRAGALATTATSQADVRQAIKNERRLELSFEYVRWFDVIRWGDAPTTFADRGFQSGKHEYLPVSQGDLILNENLEQTEGY